MSATCEPPRMLIDGAWLEEGAGAPMDVIDPSSGAVLARMPSAGAAQIDAALDAAQRATPGWRRTPPAERAALLVRATRLMRERAEPIAVTMSLEQGKPLAESRAELLRAAELIEWAAEEGRRQYGLTIPSPADARYLTFQEPIGVAAALTPWNFPAVAPARKVGSALAAGCCCILKPSELTPCTATAMARCFVDAGLPAGVLGVLLGDPREISSALIASPVVRKISFTGSVPVGKELATLAARHMKPSLMELGGHSPVLVFADADLDRMIPAAVATKFRNAGQVCTSPTRFFVEASVYERFVERFAQAAARLAVGPATDAGTQMGPVASERRAAAIASLVDDARAQGARVLAGGARLDRPGSYFAPTVLADVPPQARAMNEEPFGPLALVVPFDDVDAVLARANALPYGLAAYAFTRSIHTARRVAAGLDCGVVGINSFSGSNPETPFGGNKDSGYGREGGTEGVRAYTTTKFVIEGSL
ncbi:MAG: NAD-dependent succinate-semialdehyde dehydrogenase [Burkholderiaceae bacterium]